MVTWLYLFSGITWQHIVAILKNETGKSLSEQNFWKKSLTSNSNVIVLGKISGSASTLASIYKKKQLSNQEKTLQAQRETTTFHNPYLINFNEKKIQNSYQV